MNINVFLANKITNHDHERLLEALLIRNVVVTQGFGRRFESGFRI